MIIKPFKRALLVFFVLLAIGKMASAQQWYVSGPDHVYGGSIGMYTLVASNFPTGDSVVWTALRGRIIGQSAGPNLMYCYVQWDNNISPWASINATTLAPASSTTEMVWPAAFRGEDERTGPPVTCKDHTEK